MTILVVLLIVIASLSQALVAEDIVGCGGFIEASHNLAKLRKPSDPKLDYSHVTVKLHTLEGLVKDKTQCAPNGYYFLPIYEKGSFSLKIEGPPGWSFTPSEVPVVIDHRGCNGNEDINFHYTGFTLSGKVTGAVGGASCKFAEGGPAGVKLTLFGLDKPVSILTKSGGSFQFTNVPTGKYMLEASHPTLDILPHGPQEVELGWDNAVVDNMFSVPGYSLQGSVLSKGNPVLGVQVFLHSDDVLQVPCPEGPGSSPLSRKALCHSTSNSDGKFAFSSLPCGDYTLVPFYKGENTVFDVSPNAIQISVGHESSVVEQAFQVTGFSVGGRVVDSQGKGIGNVKIHVDNVERATTDSDGFYKLDQVTSSAYTITAARKHFKFTTLKDFTVLPNMASLPVIEATHYDLCGSVRVLGHFGKRQVGLTHGPANVKPQNKRVDDNGDFCFEVPPGEYRLTPLATAVEQEAGLLFSPQHLDVTVSAPVLGAMFAQARVSISGSVACIDGCNSRIKISLSPARSGSMADETQVTQILEDDQFVFENVFPGKYELAISSGPADDEWCWEQEKIELDVLTNDVGGIRFVQKGYWLRIEASHPARAFTLQKNNDPVPLQITKGWQQVCIESPGLHELHFVWPCVFFGALSHSFDTSDPKPIHLVGVKYVLTGQIHVASQLYSDANKLENELLVEISHEDGRVVEGENYAHLISEANETSPVAVYEYAHWAKLGDELVFSPRYKSADSSLDTTLLFYPREQHVRVAVDGCQPKVPEFSGRPGLYVTGNVVPALEGVDITVTSVSESKVGRLAAGEVAMHVESGADGVYVAGPLYDDAEYKLDAEKAGYNLKYVGNNTFECQKLAQIVVNIFPGKGAEDTLPSVLLSLSGDDGYRKNAAASPGGQFVFDNLFPGSFYLRPLLKEYVFSPAGQALELGSGETLSVTFTARRSAYSIYGTITSLSGKPEEGVYVEARSDSGGFYEETVTDVAGRYRLRGLFPNELYNIRVVLRDDLDGLPRLERASPNSHSVQVVANDTMGIDFVVFEHSPTTTLSGLVDGEDLGKWQEHLAVEVVSLREPGKIEKQIPIPLSYYFEVQDLPRDKYLVQLGFKDLSPMHKFSSDTVEVDFQKKSEVHVDKLRFSVEERHQKQELAQAPVFPVIMGISVIALLATMSSIKDAYTWATGGGTATSSVGPKKDVRKVNPVRRMRSY